MKFWNKTLAICSCLACFGASSARGELVQYLDSRREVGVMEGSSGQGRYTPNPGYWSGRVPDSATIHDALSTQTSTLGLSSMEMDGIVRSVFASGGSEAKSTLVTTFALDAPVTFDFDVSLTRMTSSMLAYYEFSLEGPNGTVFSMGDRTQFDTLTSPFEEQRVGVLSAGEYTLDAYVEAKTFGSSRHQLIYDMAMNVEAHAVPEPSPLFASAGLLLAFLSIWGWARKPALGVPG